MADAALSPDNKSVAVGSWDNTIRLFDTTTGALALSLNGHKSNVDSLSFVLKGEALISGSRDGTVVLWRASDGVRLRTFDGQLSGVISVAVEPGDLSLAYAGSEGIRLWHTNAPDHTLRLLAPAGRDVQVTLSGSARHFDLAGSDAAWALKGGLLCRIGPRTLPVEVCAERTRVPQLGSKLLAHGENALEP